MSDNKQMSATSSATASSGAQQAQEAQQAQRAVVPAVDVFEDASGITLLADMPGVSKDELELKIEGESLLIEGRVQARTPDAMEAVYAELRAPRYRRVFVLSRELDTTRIDANLKDGVLTLHIPKQAHAQPRRIEVT